MEIKEDIKRWIENKVDVVGFAPVDRFEEAPEAHHPQRMLQGAKTVIVYGRMIPRGVMKSPDYGKYFLHRSYHSVYPYLDELGDEGKIRLNTGVDVIKADTFGQYQEYLESIGIPSQ